MHVMIIGAGIVGLTTAWQLSKDGHQVTVVEREAGVGQGASFANGAQLSYSYVAPMASRAVLGSLPKWLLKSDSPVRYVPSADPAQWAWLMRFLAACTDATSAVNSAKLLALAAHSRERLHAMAGETGIAFRHARNGKLVIQSTAASQAGAEAQMALQSVMGCEQYALTPAECLALEPGLESVSGRLAGGIHTPGEEVGDCLMLCQGLYRVLAGRGVSFLFGTKASVVLDGGRVAGLDTPIGRIGADLYVLSAGIGSQEFARRAGVRVGLLPIRGYSISAPIIVSNRAPVRSITDTARKTVYAPLGDRLRVAGFAEIGGSDALHLQARSAVLSCELEAIFPGACSQTDLRPWAGLRPATPTGVPLVGACRIDNLLLNLGHGALGFTLSAGTASLIGDIVAGREPSIVARDYAV